jgi:ribonuclease HI
MHLWDTSMPIPDGWLPIFSDPPTDVQQSLGRGVGIWVRTDINAYFISRGYPSFRRIHYHRNNTFELLIASLGRWYLCSTYVFPKPEHHLLASPASSKPPYSQVIQQIDFALPSHRNARIIIGGDFNFPHHVDYLHQCMVPNGLTPLLTPGEHVTRHSYIAGQAASLLDHLFISHPDECQFTPKDDIKSVGTLSDHDFLQCRISLDIMDDSPLSLPTPTTYVRWKRLSSSAPDDLDAQRALGYRLAHISRDLDLAAIAQEVIRIAAEVLGTYAPHSRLRNPWMHDPAVRALLQLFHAARQICAITRSDASLGPEAMTGMRTIQKAFQSARDQAIQDQRLALHRKVSSGQINIFAAMSRRSSHPALHRLNPHLDHEQGVTFWRSIFSAPTQKPAAIHRCYCDNITFTITPGMFRQAITAMKVAAPGPDKIPVLAILRYCDELSEPLAAAFTRAIRQGTPDALRGAETLLFAKTNPPTANPGDYRPITLQPVLVRILHKIIDTALRKIIFGSMQDPVWKWIGESKLFHGQGGFQRYKGAPDQALLLHILTAAQRSMSRNKFLFALFLDIQKAFDSLDHGHFLDICEHNLALTPEWLEILRKILVGNYTEIFGYRIDITRGNEQGSPLSPLICLIYLDDLARVLERHYTAHPPPPRHPFHWPPVPGITRHWLLLILLLFADDILLLGLSTAELQEALTIVEQWATDRGLLFSPKGFAAVLSGSTDLPDPVPTLTVHGHPLAWITADPGIGKYMGIPFWVYKPNRRYNSAFPFPISKKEGQTFTQLVARVHRHFELPNGARLVYIPALTQVVKQLIGTKALYPTSVVTLDYDAIDSMVYDLYRKTLALPYNTPRAFLFWQLRHVPAHLDGAARGLREMGRYVHRHPVYYLIFRELFRYTGDKANMIHQQLFTSGPFHRFLEILHSIKINAKQTLREVLFPTASNPIAIFRAMETLELDKWTAQVNKFIQAAFIYWTQVEIRSHAPYFQRQLAVVIDYNMGKKLPPYMTFGGDRARAALRFQVPFLRRFADSRVPLPSCNWCHTPESEQGLHLIQCNDTPLPVRQLITQAYQAITDESKITRPTMLCQAFMRVSWRHQTQQSTILVLDAMSLTINEYIRSFEIPPEPSIAPIHTVKPRMTQQPGSDEPPSPASIHHVLYFDGASRGNPGLAGAGAVLYNPQGAQLWTGNKFVGTSHTNNEAEYAALIFGLTQACDMGIKDLDVRGDSRLIINQVQGQWCVRQPRLVALNQTARTIVSRFDNISFLAIRRRHNTLADQQSNIAIDDYIQNRLTN